MKRLVLILDQLIRGKTAAALALAGALLLVAIWLQALPWRHFPNVFRMFSASWLYLALSISLAYSAVAVVAKRQGAVTDMWACLVVGAVWKFTAALAFLPFNFSQLLMIYGLAGVVAHCFRRSRSSTVPTTIVASLPAKQVEPDPAIQPDRKT